MSSALSPAPAAECTAFACRKCGHRVTPGLWPIGGAREAVGGRDLVPAGYFARSQGEHETPVDWYMISPSDVIGHPIRPFDGCCGPSGFTKPNIGCAEGHAVGIEQSECYLPHVTVFDPALVFEVDGAESSIQPIMIGRHGGCRTLEQFCNELHTAFGFTEWYGADLALILGKWGCRSPARIDLIWMYSDVSRESGLPMGDIVEAFAEQAAFVRLFLA